MRTALLALIALTSAAPTAAEVSFLPPPFLGWPVDCTLGATCVIEDYVDAEPGPGSRDHACGLKSRDGHRGTDIALLSDDQMRAGVAVFAAADGVVAAVRDGVPDRRIADPADVAGQECGNAVRLSHENGHETLYCHMAEGSVAVAPGQRVTAGEALGRIGLSGQTNFPHLHLTVLKDGIVIDPFAPLADGTCKATEASLWIDPPAYSPAGLFTAGFSRGVPEFTDVQSGAARIDTLAPGDPLVLYTNSFHAAPGDVLHFRATGPAGTIFDHSVLLTDPQLQTYRAYGKRAPSEGWPRGTYDGQVRLMRGDVLLAVRLAHVTLR